MPEGCLHMCCTACPCNAALHYASNTIFMYEEFRAGHRMYVGSAKLVSEATYFWNLQIGHIATAVLTRYPAISERLYTTARHLGLLQTIQSFRKCTHIVCYVTSNVSGEFSGGVTWTPWAGRQVGTGSRPACCKPYQMALWTCHVLESF